MGLKSGTDCVVAGTQLELFDRGTESIEAIPVLWQNDLDLEEFIKPKTDTGNNEGYTVLKASMLKNYKNFVKPLYSANETEVFPIFRVKGTVVNPQSEQNADDGQLELFKVQFTDKSILEVTSTHPFLTQGDTVTPASKLNPGNTVSTPTGVKEVEGCTESKSDGQKIVYNIGLGSREVLELLKLMLLTLWDGAKLDRSQKELEFEVAKGFMETVLTVLKEHGETSFLGLEPKEHVIFTDNVATGSITLQYLLEAYGYPNRFVDINGFA